MLFAPVTETSAVPRTITGLQPSTYTMESQTVLLPMMEIQTLLDPDTSPELLSVTELH